MIEKLAETATGLVAVKVSGKLDHDDFAKLSEWIKATVASQGRCRLLIEFGDFRGWDAEGLADDLRFHLIGSKDVERIAYVGAKAWERALVDLSKPVTLSPIRYFDFSEMEDAYAWLAGD